jgi:3-deoxy-D-manno-octulosonate 8-phosphate phosphatase KdsC-like HAD superfamily phosphatase
MGDDVNDVDCLRAVGLSFAPSDAVREAKAAAWTVTSARGGEGAVREAAELILMLNRTAEAP